MDENDVRKDIENINAPFDRFTEVVNVRMEITETAGNILTDSFVQDIEIRLDVLTPTLTHYISALALRANYTIIRVTFHASPEIISLILAMVWIYRIITFAISVFNILQIIGTVWQINQMIVALWPRYRDWFNGVLTQVSEISGYIGWGVDGIGHLINACAGGINVVGGLMGKDWNLMRLEIMERSNELVVQMSRMLTSLKDDPGRVLNQLFENRTLLSAYDTDKWWRPISQTIATASDRAQTAITGVQGVLGELSAIQTNMPEVVRQNIPTQIWDSLARADSYIFQYIIPTLETINRNFTIINNLIDSISQRGSELADKLAHPGDILLGVDDLPDYMKTYQQGLIDDVTSREFELWTNLEREEMGADLDEFDRIDRLATAPTPEPAFLTMEVAVGKTVRGITAEYKENWFVGDY